MLVNLLVSFFLFYFVFAAARGIQLRISGYAGNRVLSASDTVLLELCDFLQTYGSLLISSAGTVIAVFVFYRKKIRVPLAELEHVSKAIAENNLDCPVTYQNRDELGRLCAEFEKMRLQLEENHKKMWRLIEQEKTLRAAVAHDLRSPLAILKGYQEMLLEFIPQKAVEEEKIMEMLLEGMGQIERIEAFLAAMRKLSRLEDREVKKEAVSFADFAGQCRRNVKMLAEKSDAACEVVLQKKQVAEIIYIDAWMVFEVLENLLTNALRYAKDRVTIYIAVKVSALWITVQDDGEGYSQEESVLTKAYYHANPQGDLEHFGLGLYLSRLYCEKHGGKLLLGSAPEGGASAAAVFDCADGKIFLS